MLLCWAVLITPGAAVCGWHACGSTVHPHWGGARTRWGGVL